MKLIIGFICFFFFIRLQASPFCSGDTITNWQIYLNHKIVGSGNQVMRDKPLSSVTYFNRNDTLVIYHSGDIAYTLPARYIEIRNRKNRLIRLYEFKDHYVFKEMTNL